MATSDLLGEHPLNSDRTIADRVATQTMRGHRRHMPFSSVLSPTRRWFMALVAGVVVSVVATDSSVASATTTSTSTIASSTTTTLAGQAVTVSAAVSAPAGSAEAAAQWLYQITCNPHLVHLTGPLAPGSSERVGVLGAPVGTVCTVSQLGPAGGTWTHAATRASVNLSPTVKTVGAVSGQVDVTFPLVAGNNVISFVNTTSTNTPTTTRPVTTTSIVAGATGGATTTTICTAGTTTSSTSTTSTSSTTTTTSTTSPSSTTSTSSTTTSSTSTTSSTAPTSTTTSTVASTTSSTAPSTTTTTLCVPTTTTVATGAGQSGGGGGLPVTGAPQHLFAVLGIGALLAIGATIVRRLIAS